MTKRKKATNAAEKMAVIEFEPLKEKETEGHIELVNKVFPGHVTSLRMALVTLGRSKEQLALMLQAENGGEIFDALMDRFADARRFFDESSSSIQTAEARLLVAASAAAVGNEDMAA